MTVKLALSKAEDAKKMANDAQKVATEALGAAQNNYIRHQEHEKICAIRAGDFKAIAASIEKKLDTALSGAYAKLFWVGVAIISALGSTIFYMFSTYIVVHT